MCRRHSVLALGLFALLLLLPATGRALDLEEVLDALASATGLPRDEALEGAVHVRSRVEGLALEGSSEAWAEAPTYSWSRLQLGPIVMETGYDGAEAWIMDRNGVVRRAEASEEAGALMEALLATGTFLLRRPPVPLIRELLEPDERGRPRISIKAWGAEPQILVLNPETWLLEESLWNNGQMEMRTEYLDYQPENGIQVARRARISFGEQMELEMVLTEIEFTEPRGKDAYSRPPRSEDGLIFHGGSDSGALPMLGEGLHIVIEGILDDDHRGRFLLDTGAGSSIVATRRLEDLGLEAEGDLQALGAAGTAEAGLVQVERLELGRLEFPPQSWMNVDLAPLGSGFDDESFLGVLGYDTLNRVVIEIDYEEREVRLHEREAFRPPSNAHEIPLRMDGNIPSAPVRVEGIETWVHLDTGSNGSLDLTAPFVEEHGLLDEVHDRGERRESGVSGVGGRSTAVRGSLHSFEIADVELTDLAANFSLSGEGLFGSTEIAGIVGAEILSRFHLYLDYEDGRAWLIPRPAGP